MSNRKKAAGQVPTYSQQARAQLPGYAKAGQPCDVPDCGGRVSGSRTITFVASARRDDLSILVRLCPVHMRITTEGLYALLPALGAMADAAGPTRFGSEQTLAPDSADPE